MSPQTPEPPHPTGAEELVQAEISVEGLELAATQADVIAAVQSRPGVRTVHVVEKSLHIVYDPLYVTELELEAAISGSGHRICGGSAERDSPFSEL
jgi:hypothetical protein